MPLNPRRPHIPLPKGWNASVKSAVLHVISLARFATAYTRSWAAGSSNARVRLPVEVERLKSELALWKEQGRIKDSRMSRISPQRRPQYMPPERLAILEIKAAQGWSLEQTAKAFLITAATIASWMKRLDEDGPDALVQLPVPVNKFPDFTRYVVQRLKTLCPTMGKVKIAQMLARAGLHLGATTVGRMLKQKPCYRPPFVSPELTDEERIITAKCPNHVWHVDLTVVPIGVGFWCSWLPMALPQHWPFCHWMAIVVDHFSRSVMGVATFKSQPNCRSICGFLGRTIAKANKTPKYIVCDRGSQFDCKAFRKWCKRKGIKPPRYGAIGRHGSIAVVERTILTIKCLLSCLLLVPYRREAFRRELNQIVHWYNQFRPHTWLGGKTPNEVYFSQYPANRRPRFEPRECWPRSSPCAKPWALVRGSPGTKLVLEVRFHAGRKHLPIVSIKRAA